MKLKFMATYLYPFPPSLKLCEPIDSSDIRYLNMFYFPIKISKKKPLNIELYNEIWFDNPSRISQPLFDYNHITLIFSDLN